jgi:molecular chaperone Hsp33
MGEGTPEGDLARISREVCRLSSYLDSPRDLLLVVGDPRPLHRDLELHLLSLGIRHDDATMDLLKDGLSALALYQTSRPRFQSFGWTINLQKPPRNLFFTGSPGEGTVVGRAFLENVERAPSDRFYAQTVWPHGESRTSAVEMQAADVFIMVEEFGRKSDQLPLRLFRGDEGRVALLLAFPDAPREWFMLAQAEEVFALEREGGMKLVNEHEVVFRCGCDARRIAQVLGSIYRERPEELFEDDPTLEAECPRCGAKYQISREDLGQPGPG